MIASVVLIAGLIGSVAAQSSSTGYSTPYTVDPNTITIAQRNSWCVNQRTTCLDVCNQVAFPNNCSSTDLSWSCTCTNMATPNITAYEQTIPFFLCQAWQAQCQIQNTNDAVTQKACLAVDCGHLVASPNSSTSSSSSSSAAASTSSSAAASSGSGTATTTASGTGGAAGSATSAAASATKTGAAAALEFSQSYGTGIFGAAAIALFGLAL